MAAGLVVPLDESFSRPAFESFRQDCSSDGLRGIIVAQARDCKAAVAIAYGPEATKDDIYRATEQAFPYKSMVRLRSITPPGISPGGFWHGYVSQYEGHEGAWEVYALPALPSKFEIFVKTLNGKVSKYTAMHRILFGTRTPETTSHALSCFRQSPWK